MCAEKTDHKPNLILSVLSNKCPRCRRGDLYQHKNPYRLGSFMKMNENCPVCGQPTEPETGFYFGTGYVSYALSIALSVATFVAWFVLIGFSLYDSRLFWWLGINGVILVALQPILMRVSRSIWLAFFVYYDRNWRLQYK
ncbi:DUF983 domain-containing protein [Chitinophaga sp. SYP-B3965]|uniref:DUF983 domain-containing protein n=1 Tax=Chitinophaga sp. SYP-B3965 TaxID=2663120 RepID=UPI0012997FF5|nr:DUF983 domain-containing protein [Chitinophaga sp. SYP-B3965]MRG44941.1 DUF983 domain-containing protein [Chitinophaga sp. SYP-B3965]